MSPGERPVFLVGFMASGKSAVGRRLAERSGWDFLDTDERVERAEGRSVREQFEESGEDRFREAEREALRALEGRRRLVVATGGGAFADSGNRSWIRARGRSIWLDVPLEIVRERLGRGADRPLRSALAPAGFRALFEQRKPSYALADLRVEAWPGSPDEVSRRILESVRFDFQWFSGDSPAY